MSGDSLTRGIRPGAERLDALNTRRMELGVPTSNYSFLEREESRESGRSIQSARWERSSRPALSLPLGPQRWTTCPLSTVLSLRRPSTIECSTAMDACVQLFLVDIPPPTMKILSCRFRDTTFKSSPSLVLDLLGTASTTRTKWPLNNDAPGLSPRACRSGPAFDSFPPHITRSCSRRSRRHTHTGVRFRRFPPDSRNALTTLTRVGEDPEPAYRRAGYSVTQKSCPPRINPNGVAEYLPITVTGASYHNISGPVHATEKPQH